MALRRSATCAAATESISATQGSPSCSSHRRRQRSGRASWVCVAASVHFDGGGVSGGSAATTLSTWTLRDRDFSDRKTAVFRNTNVVPFRRSDP